MSENPVGGIEGRGFRSDQYSQSKFELKNPEMDVSLVGEEVFRTSRNRALRIAEEAIDNMLVLRHEIEGRSEVEIVAINENGVEEVKKIVEIKKPVLSFAFGTAQKIVSEMDALTSDEEVMKKVRGVRFPPTEANSEAEERAKFLVEANRSRIADSIPFNRIVQEFIDVYYNDKILAQRREAASFLLTEQERKVLPLMPFQDKEIAEKLFVSHRTIGSHVASIISKLQCQTRGGAIVEGLRFGLLNLRELAILYELPTLPSLNVLTPKERAIVKKRIEFPGLLNQEYADMLVIGKRTFDTHLANIAGKLGLDSTHLISVQAFLRDSEQWSRFINSKLPENIKFPKSPPPKEERSRDIKEKVAKATNVKVHKPPEAIGGLSIRESEIMELVGQGIRTNGDIAEALSVSPRTVEAHLLRIYKKLGIHGRSEGKNRALVEYQKAKLRERLAKAGQTPSDPSDTASQSS